jgi:hypothetical protein
MSEEDNKLEEASAQVVDAFLDLPSLCRAQQTVKWRDDPLTVPSNSSVQWPGMMAVHL